VNSLFPIEPTFPDGFMYFPEFITVQEEMNLIKELRLTEFQTFHFQGYEAKRKVASFGYDYSFDKRSLSKGKDIPEVYNYLIQRVAEKLTIPDEEFSELLLTEYPPGSVINWHRDAPPFDSIAGISLLTDCTFRLRPQDKTLQNRKSIISFPVLRRSLYIMKGEARSNWQHSISPVKEQRYSITLRTLRKQL
jgi:alkylated DNA repair dioxygenase AlkB